MLFENAVIFFLMGAWGPFFFLNLLLFKKY